MGRARAGLPPIAQLAQKKAAALRKFGAGAALEFSSTSHISIVDKYGDALAMTTIEDIFGSRPMTRSEFLLNNGADPRREGTAAGD